MMVDSNSGIISMVSMIVGMIKMIVEEMKW